MIIALECLNILYICLLNNEEREREIERERDQKRWV